MNIAEDFMHDADSIASDLAEILDDASAKLRKLMERAIQAELFASLSELARVAEGVASLRDRGQLVAAAVSQVTSSPLGKQSSNGETNAVIKELDSEEGRDFSSLPRRGKRVTYPYFERDGERLVKIGWSKKDSSAYEHRAAQSAALAVCRALRTTRKNFTMDEVLPVRTDDGTEVPSYQVYMVVAWLRQLGLVDRNGNDGYTARREGLTDKDVDRIWESLPEYERTV